jgi:hypothetical protein
MERDGADPRLLPRVDLLLVLTVIALAAALLLAEVPGALARARTTAALARVAELRVPLQEHYALTGIWPPAGAVASAGGCTHLDGAIDCPAVAVPVTLALRVEARGDEHALWWECRPAARAAFRSCATPAVPE